VANFHYTALRVPSPVHTGFRTSAVLHISADITLWYEVGN